MKIEAFVICKNEELIMPHLLNYYSQFCQKITFYDNESTDNTLNIINNFDLTYQCFLLIILKLNLFHYLLNLT